MPPELSLILTAYDEEEALPRSLPPIIEALRKLPNPWEMILVNNGSEDTTRAVMENFSNKHSGLRIVDVSANRGYGYGVRRGLEAGRGTYVGFMCPDGQIDPRDVAAVLRKMRAVGPRGLVKVRRIAREDGPVRWLVSRLYNLVFLLFFGRICDDANGTPKIAEGGALRAFRLRSNDWFLDAEFMIRAKQRRLRITEIPVTFHPRREGRSNVRASTALEFLRNMIAFRFRRP